MNLEEAIKVLRGNVDCADCGEDPYGEKAHQLGIEGLERLELLRGFTKAGRTWLRMEILEPLPSEEEK